MYFHSVVGYTAAFISIKCVIAYATVAYDSRLNNCLAVVPVPSKSNETHWCISSMVTWQCS